MNFTIWYSLSNFQPESVQQCLHISHSYAYHGGVGQCDLVRHKMTAVMGGHGSL